MIRSRRMFAHSPKAAIVLGCLWLAALGGCGSRGPAPAADSRIPDFARPHQLTGDEGMLTADLIEYRKIRREDFRAAHPPAMLGENSRQMGAVTCATIKSRPGAEFTLVRRGLGVEVMARGLVFEALMDRGCSWWNEARAVYSDAYVLEHEQVHFALFEVEARRLTKRAARAKVAGSRSVSPDELAERLQERVDREVDESAEAVLKRSLLFDEDTSFQEQPERQRRWLEEVEAELRDLPR
jgi:hypothetical protein